MARVSKGGIGETQILLEAVAGMDLGSGVAMFPGPRNELQCSCTRARKTRGGLL